MVAVAAHEARPCRRRIRPLVPVARHTCASDRWGSNVYHMWPSVEIDMEPPSNCVNYPQAQQQVPPVRRPGSQFHRSISITAAEGGGTHTGFANTGSEDTTETTARASAEQPVSAAVSSTCGNGGRCLELPGSLPDGTAMPRVGTTSQVHGFGFVRGTSAATAVSGCTQDRKDLPLRTWGAAAAPPCACRAAC